jgi:hypothetical protein
MDDCFDELLARREASLTPWPVGLDRSVTPNVEPI